MTFDLPSSVFHVRLAYRSWLSHPDWLCTLSHETSQSTGEALTPDLAYEIAVAKARLFVPRPKTGRVLFDFNINLDI